MPRTAVRSANRRSTPPFRMPNMQATQFQSDQPYAKCIEVSKRVRWDIDEDVIRGKGLNPSEPIVLSGNYQLDDGMRMRVAKRDGKGAQ